MIINTNYSDGDYIHPSKHPQVISYFLVDNISSLPSTTWIFNKLIAPSPNVPLWKLCPWFNGSYHKNSNCYFLLYNLAGRNNRIQFEVSSFQERQMTGHTRALVISCKSPLYSRLKPNGYRLNCPRLIKGITRAAKFCLIIMLHGP